ncbi:ABC transporter permease [Ruminiclostridium cellobioparum]|jgi:ribose transport system permease protein|uniref:Ribose/xylose/arabinose/galactoside ABC transporter permease n=1 Tax=Ruminiclostridium cellobioparum subsp. termitidis CT1112 TaxID=1195236 RepID=S0FLU7_RUMCE|nr:ABC transporter permease [Ruminiclostridium cellobioparum]EMS70139.1 ribose/xylose/arabinose/galactoside ABC transporter permease [Ruminiclostridium cellobioparum subsp. termitidis CT1112]
MELIKSNQNQKLKAVTRFAKENFVIIAFAILLIYGSLASPAFLTVSNIKTVLLQNSIYAICAIGMLLIVITGGIDLSVGSFVVVSVCFTAGFIQDGHGILAIIFVILLCIVFGIVSGILVAYAKVAPFIATLAMMTILKGIAYMYQVGQNRRIDGTFLPKFIQGNLWGIPIPVIILALIFVVFAVILRKTKYGRGIYAIGGNAETARLAGINVKKYLIITYALGGLLFGIAGMILAGRLSMGTATVGEGYELDAIAAVVVGGASLSGGVGSVTKTLIGAFLMGVLINIMNLMGIASYPQMILKGVIIVFAVLANRDN